MCTTGEEGSTGHVDGDHAVTEAIFSVDSISDAAEQVEDRNRTGTDYLCSGAAGLNGEMRPGRGGECFCAEIFDKGNIDAPT
jgi:hypothetical protein